MHLCGHTVRPSTYLLVDPLRALSELLDRRNGLGGGRGRRGLGRGNGRGGASANEAAEGTNKRHFGKSGEWGAGLKVGERRFGLYSDASGQSEGGEEAASQVLLLKGGRNGARVLTSNAQTRLNVGAAKADSRGRDQ